MFDFEKLSASKLYAAPHVERVVEFSPPGVDIENIAKVLSLSVEAKCNCAEAFDGYAEVTGRTNFRLTYLDKNGDPKGVDYNADFSVKAEGEFCAADAASATITVVESDVSAAGALTLSAVLEVCVTAVQREELNVLMGADKCYKTSKTIALPAYIASKTSVCPFDAEQDVGGEITSVLSMGAHCPVIRAEAVDGGIKAAAKLSLNAVYVEGGEIKQRDFIIDLEEELNLDGVREGDKVLIDACVKSSKIVLQGVTDDNVLRVEGDVAFKAQVFRLAQVEVVDDLFTLENEVDITKTSAKYAYFDGSAYFAKKVSGTATLGDNRAAAIKIDAIPSSRCYTTKAATEEDGSLTVEGIVNADIVYTDENGFNSVRAEVPFSLNIQNASPFAGEVKVRADIEKISADIRREREIDIDIALRLATDAFAETDAEFISGVELGEERAQNTSGISLYIAREGDEILDLCKAFSAMPEDILAQNPALTFPLAEGERAVYFRQIAI